MPAVNSIQTNFTGGEMSPLARGRVDLTRYANGLNIARNGSIMPAGGFTSRMGTKFVAALGQENRKARVVPFIFSQQDAYAIVFEHEKIRFYKNYGRIENPVTVPVELTSPYTEDDLQDLNFAQSADVLFIAHPRHDPRRLNRFSDILWTLEIIDFNDGPYLDENADETLTMTASAVTGSITITASAPYFNPNMVGAIMRLEEASATKHTPWTSGVAYATGKRVLSDGKVYQAVSASADSSAENRGLPEWQNGVAYPVGYYAKWGVNVYISQNAATSGNTPPTHVAGVVGDGGVNWLYHGKITGNNKPTHVKGTESDGVVSWTYLHGGFGIAEITGYVSDTVVNATVLSRLPDSTTAGTINWREGAWSDANGFPSFVTFYQDRLTFARTKRQKQGLWLSNVGEYDNFAPTVEGGQVIDSNAIYTTVNSDEQNEIAWLLSVGRGLLIGTLGGEFELRASASNQPVTPTNYSINPQGNVGSESIAAVRIGSGAVYVQLGGQRVRNIKYNFTIEGYDSDELTLLADHILRDGGKGVAMTYAQKPWSQLFVLREDGKIAVCTVLLEQQVVAWGLWETDGVIESIAAVPSPDSKENNLWIVVRREINGVDRRYVEAIGNSWQQGNEQLEFLDSYIKYDGASTTLLTGLDHLAGKFVDVVYDNYWAQGLQVLPTGELALPRPVTKAIIGLPFAKRLTTLPLEVQGEAGTAQAKVKRIHEVGVRLHETNALRFGSGFVARYNLAFRSPTMLMGQFPELFTGDKKMLLNQSYVRDGILTLESLAPLPFTVLAVMPEVVVYE